ncbi:LCP family protein [Kitasatospora sp. NPDC004615]|uniref:LCP family protein n=1 Tax=Kitasatospora sp. NPDC004615 TaxID=3364017 RepID=UPI00367E96CB
MTDGNGEFEVHLGAAFGQAGGGPGPEVTARLVDGGLAVGRRLKRARRRRAALLGGALAAAVVVGAGVLTVPHGVPGVRSNAIELANSATPPPSAPPEQGVTILLVGLGSGLGALGGPVDTGPDSPDTLILVHVPKDGGEVRQLSVPRDLLVPDGHDGNAVISDLYPKAELAEMNRLRGQGLAADELRRRGREAGRAALITAVEQVAEMPVDHFAEISMAGFDRVVHALGGVPVCLNEAVKDSWSGVRLPAGKQELGPAQALAFVRQRHGIGDGSDVQRTTRAQALLAGVLTKLRTGGVLADPAKLSALYDAFSDQLVTDKGWSPVDFVRQVPALAAGRGTATTLPIAFEGTHVRTADGAAKQILLGSGPVPSVSPNISEETGEAYSGNSGQAPVKLDGVPCVD